MTSVSFYWKDAFNQLSLPFPCPMVDKQAPEEGESSMFGVPNGLIQGLWFVLPETGKQHTFPPGVEGGWRSDPALVARNYLIGTAFVSVDAIGEGEELLLDYDLRDPLPTWAKDWYIPATKQ